MAKSSINIQAASSHCFAHNDRSDKVTYLIDDPKLNECSTPAAEAKQSLDLMVKAAEKYRRENGMRAMKSDTIKAVEAVVNLNASHTLADVQRLAEKIETEFGFRAVQIAVHRDEGHVTEDGRKEKNYHAHIVMCNLTPEGKTIQRTLGRDGLKKLQDITAETLGMERGKSADITGAKHIEHRVYKIVTKETEALQEQISRGQAYIEYVEAQKEAAELAIVPLKATIEDKDAQIIALRKRAEEAEKRTEIALEALEAAKATIETQKGEIERLKANIDDLARMRNEDREKLKASGTATPADYSALKKAHDDLKAEAMVQIKAKDAEITELKGKVRSYGDTMGNQLKTINELNRQLREPKETLPAPDAEQIKAKDAEIIELKTENGRLKEELAAERATAKPSDLKTALEELKKSELKPKYTGQKLG